MLDTLAIARELKDAGVEPKQADAITRVFRQAAEHGDPATRADLEAHRAEVRSEFKTHRAEVRSEFDAHRAEVRADLAAIEVRLIKWMIGIALTATGIIVAAGAAFAAAILRTLG